MDCTGRNISSKIIIKSKKMTICLVNQSMKNILSLMNNPNINHACQLSIVACIHPNVILIDKVSFETLKALQPLHFMLHVPIIANE